MSRSLFVPFVVALAGAACTSGSDSTPDESELEQGLTKQCPTTTLEGIDISHGQGVVDFAMVAASGRTFAFIKATQGDYNKQATFGQQWGAAGTAGIVRSPYHFFDPTKDGVAQANWYLGELQTVGGLPAGELPPMLDIECPTSSVQAQASANCEYTGDSGWVDSATLSQRVFDWLSTVQAATGRTPIIYSYPSWFGDVGFTDSRLAGYPLYIATLSTCASVPAPWTSTVFWQYSFTGTVPGVTGQVDLDRFVGSAGDLVTFTHPSSTGDAGVGDGAANPEAGGGGGDASSGSNGNNGPGRGCGCGASGGDAAGVFAVLIALGTAAMRRRRRAQVF